MSENDSQRPQDVGNAGETQQQPRVQVESTPAGSNIPYVQAYDTQTGQPLGGQQVVNKHTVVKTKTKKLPIFITALAGCACGALLVIALIMSGTLDIGGGKNAVTAGASGSSTQKITIDSEDTTLAEAVSAKALPSVVSITATSSGSQNGSLSQSADESDNSGSVGSGVVLDTEGHILTNNHVVDGYDQYVVTMDDGTTYEAEFVGNDASSDLAVIKLKDADASKLTPIEIGDSSKLNVGEWVMAIGSPFGNEQSVSTGIVSALYRSTAMSSTNGNTIYANMIQTDAAINPGNSGGALVNDNGELVGINSLIESYSGSSSGVGFAIPVNYAKNIADQIIDGKTPVHPYLGATLSSVNALNARTNKLSTDSGAYVASVVEDGPAAKAGIQEGDVITKLGDDEITSADGLIIALRSHEVGEKVEITLMRGKEEKKVTVELGSDEELQNQQQDDSSTDTGNGGITDEQLRQYLEELLGQQGQGQGAGTAGILDAGGVGIAHVDHGQHVQQARTAAPPDDAAGHFAGHAVLAAQHARGGDAVLGLHVDLAVQQQVADAGQAHQMDALFRVGDGAGRQLQLGAPLPVGGGAAYLEPDGGLPAGDLHLVAVLVGQFLAGDALERGLGRGALAKSQQGAEGPGGIDAKLTARHAQTAFLH